MDFFYWFLFFFGWTVFPTTRVFWFFSSLLSVYHIYLLFFFSSSDSYLDIYDPPPRVVGVGTIYYLCAVTTTCLPLLILALYRCRIFGKYPLFNIILAFWRSTGAGIGY